jgi:Family of unknown function (DUF6286)
LCCGDGRGDASSDRNENVRTVNRIVAAVLALGLLVGGVLLTVEIILGLAGRDPWIIPWDTWYREARQNAWSATSVRWLFYGLGAAGVVLLALQLLPRRPTTLPVASDSDADVVVVRKNLESTLARAATRIDGVNRASTRVGKTSVAVKARSHRRDPGDLATSVADAVRRTHDALQPNQTRDVRVQLDTPRRR